MVDKVKPLKIENPATGGTQADMFPTEANPLQDYQAVKGLALENNDARLIDLDGAGNIQFKDAIETTAVTVRKLRTALNNIFDNTSNGFISTNVQAAIEEAKATAVQASVSAFIAAYGGNANVGRYLEIFPSIGSDSAGLLIPISAMQIKAITLGAVSAATGTMGIFKATDLITPVYSISLTAQVRTSQSGLNIPFLFNEEIVIRVTAGTFNKPFMRVWLAGVI